MWTTPHARLTIYGNPICKGFGATEECRRLPVNIQWDAPEVEPPLLLQMAIPRILWMVWAMRRHLWTDYAAFFPRVQVE